MYKFLVILLVAALLSLGLAYPEILFQTDEFDSTVFIIDDEVSPGEMNSVKDQSDYDVPRPEGEPLPPPPDDDEPRMGDLGPDL